MRRRTFALAAAILLASLAPGASASAFSLAEQNGSLTGPGGGALLSAGAHPDLTTEVVFPTRPNAEGRPVPDGNVKDVDIKLPPGFVGNPNATPTCDVNDLKPPAPSLIRCSPDAQIGLAKITNFGQTTAETTLPLYNLTPQPGVAAEFGVNVNSVLVLFKSGVVDDGEYRIETRVAGISQALALGDTEVTLWGVPAAASHNSERFVRGAYEQGAESFAEPRPFLRSPTSCTGAPSGFSSRGDFWEEPGAFSEVGFDHDRKGSPLVFVACNSVPFSATISARPTTAEADSPSGLDLTITVPQNESPNGIATSDLRDATVTLPEGMTIDPATAGGLGSCSAAQIGIGGDAPAACPESSKIGTVEIVSPLVDHPLEGSVYVARQGDNRFGSLLALYLAVDDEATGTVLKLAGKVATDPTSGRIVASFERNPQLPFESLSVDLAGGPRAPLTTPASCGTYTAQASLAPWSGNAPVSASDSFRITSGPGGSACPNGAFAPKLEASPSSPLAGSFAPLDLTFSRADGTGRLGGLEVALPKGLLAKLAGVPYCPDAALGAIPTAPGTGAAQLASPSCPAASRVGSVVVTAGSGGLPVPVRGGSAYLAGPYRGAPLSLAIVAPALAGPFDLGNVVVRAALRVDPTTAQVTATSDPLPTILDGIPLDLRSVDVDLDRSAFTLMPTSCEPRPFGGVATSATGQGAPLGAPFGAVGCAGLGFAPKLALSLKGSSRRGGYPRLIASLRTRPGDANIGAVTVSLPDTEFLAQGHIGTVCTRPQFAAEACPSASLYGYAEARTPLLGEPLKGPVYLRANGGERKLPDLVAALHGQIDIDLVGFIDSRKGGIRTRFLGVPDAPIQSFTLKLKGGKKSLLQNSADLCAAMNVKARVLAVGQNGRRHPFASPLKPSCGKKRGA